MASRTFRTLCVLSSAFALACGDDTAAGPIDIDATPDAAMNEPDANHELPDASDDEPDASDLGDEVSSDRCNAEEPCPPSLLVPQEELEFLEPMGDGWLRLMEADWQLAPNSEGYRCMTFTIPEDVYITAFYPQAPPGTHHATYGVMNSPIGPDEVVACGVGTAGERRLHGSGAGSDPIELPEGVAQPLLAGQQVMMNLHLFNVSDEPLLGRSGVWVKTAAKEEIEHEAETILAGPLMLSIPPGRVVQSGRCTIGGDVTLYSVAPHMHQTGAHMRAVAHTAAGEIEIHDGPYDFMDQTTHLIDELQLQQGDSVEVECTYENVTDRVIAWGDSSLDEMCFIGLSVYPAMGLSGGLPCAN